VIHYRRWKGQTDISIWTGIGRILPDGSGWRAWIKVLAGKFSLASLELPKGDLVWIMPENVSPGMNDRECMKPDPLHAHFDSKPIKRADSRSFDSSGILVGRFIQF
jgi:hypothetical protein